MSAQPLTSKKSQAVPEVPACKTVREGLRCRACGCTVLPVYYTRHRDHHILRVRHCDKCGRKLITREEEI